MSQVTLVGLLLGALLAVLALLVWQQARRHLVSEPVVYGIEDAVSFVAERLDPDVAGRLGIDGIRRILEWEVFYLQGLAQPDRRHPVVAVAGGSEAAVEYITGEVARAHGVSYSPADIAAVLGHEAEYLEAIGAVGDPVTDPAAEGVGGEGKSMEEGEPR